MITTIIDTVGIGPGPLVAVTAALILWRGLLTLPTLPTTQEAHQ